MTSVVKIADFRPAVRRRIHEDIAEQLRDAILDGRFPAGSKLPPERELATEFKVNRTSIRDAVKVLEGLSLIRVRQGDGATVQLLVDASFDLLPAMVSHGGRLDVRVLLSCWKLQGRFCSRWPSSDWSDQRTRKLKVCAP